MKLHGDRSQAVRQQIVILCSEGSNPFGRPFAPAFTARVRAYNVRNKTTFMEKQEAIKALALYQVGAIHCASAHLGFDLYADKLTKTQAKKFHKFITPLLSKVCQRLEGDEKEMEELVRVYQETMPPTLLCYLLKKEFTSD